MQAKLVLHVCRHATAYLDLLLPHSANRRVWALLSTLAACGSEEEAGVLADSSSAQSYLWLLVALADRLGSSAAAGGTGLSEAQAGLLAAALTSAVHALAAVEGELRLSLSSQLSQGRKGKKLSPQQLEEKVEDAVRCAGCVQQVACPATLNQPMLFLQCPCSVADIGTLCSPLACTPRPVAEASCRAIPLLLCLPSMASWRHASCDACCSTATGSAAP